MPKLDKFDTETVATLRELEVPMNILGFQYIRTAMKVMSGNSNAIYGITTDLYPSIAKIHNTKPSRVERAIRHARVTAYADIDARKKVLGTAREMPNGEFLATLHEVVRLKVIGEVMA